MLALAGGLLVPPSGMSSHEAKARFPPRLSLSTKGDELWTKRGSFCTKTLCADGPARETRRTLRVCPGNRIQVAIRAHSKQLAIFESESNLRYARAHQRSPQRWFFGAGDRPPTGTRLTLELFVRYDRAKTGFIDAFFYGTIKRAESCSAME